MRDRYEGICYDGPYEGRAHAHYAPYFRVAIYDDIRSYVLQPYDLSGPQTTKHGEYRWSEPLRKWVWRG